MKKRQGLKVSNSTATCLPPQGEKFLRTDIYSFSIYKFVLKES